MKQVIYHSQKKMIDWASDRIGGNQFRDDAKAIGVMRNDHLVGVVVFDAFAPGSCCVSVASDGTARWLSREFLIRVFAYPFIQCGFRRLTALISEHNAASIKFCESVGFIREGILRQDGSNGEDLLVYGLLRSECRFLPSALLTSGNQTLTSV